jgi:hypothetical protein
MEEIRDAGQEQVRIPGAQEFRIELFHQRIVEHGGGPQKELRALLSRGRPHLVGVEKVRTSFRERRSRRGQLGFGDSLHPE